MDPQEELSDDEIEARQRAADGEATDHNPRTDGEGGDGNGQGDDSAGGDAEGEEKPKADANTDTEQGDEGAADKTAGADGGQGGKVEGVASKDGSRILPYGALQAARRDARRAESRAERAERELAEAKEQIENLKSGKATPEGEELTEEVVAAAEAEFPEHGAKLRAAFNRIQALEKQKPKQEEKSDEEPGDDPVQEAIDQVPLLVEWQAGNADLFARAIEIDAVLAKSPKWKDKSAVERFTEVARQVAHEHDIEFPEAKTNTSTNEAPKGAAKPNPAEKAVRKTPETLSDFKGGSVADHGQLDSKLPAPALLNRMQDMTDDEIDAHLAKYG